ncbi:MAG: SGNH/GDSL hydrolase family protein [Nitrospirae bacterium]|nr:SGNH/GDSL hydrolase family protein [Nitrospirota bacterium]
MSILICVFSGEIFLRIYRPEFGRLQWEDPFLGSSSSEYQRFNPNQFKGDKKRILFLGDSFLAGSAVKSLSNRFPVLLNNKLGDSAEIQILATGGWGTDQELLGFLQKGKAWKPDIVVIAFVDNDIANILSNRQGDVRKPFFAIDEQDNLKLFDGFGHPLSYETIMENIQTSRWNLSYLFNFIWFHEKLFIGEYLTSPEDNDIDNNVDLRYLLFRNKREIQKAKFDEIYNNQDKLSWSPERMVLNISAYIHEDFPLNTYQWSLLEKILLKFNDEVRGSNAELYLMLLPNAIDQERLETISGGTYEKIFQTPTGRVTLRSAEPRDRLAIICKKTGIVFYDPTPLFIDKIKKHNLMKSIWPKRTEGHFNDLGHKILAEIIYDFFKADSRIVKIGIMRTKPVTR